MLVVLGVPPQKAKQTRLGRCKSCPVGLDCPAGSNSLTDCVTHLGGCLPGSQCETSAVVRLALPRPVSSATATICGRVEILEANAPDYSPVNQDWGTICKWNHDATVETWDDGDASVC